ncbi:MAG: DNA polymerase III subunit epsilon [Gammaproteobacteria bacterium]
MNTRLVILDTETTGLSPEAGHRIIEIGCVELKNRLYTGRTLHHYLNPERKIEAGAQDVHGISDEQLVDKPLFVQIAPELREFVAGAELIIHNAPFDLAFLDAEYRRIDSTHGSVSEWCSVLDTLALARARYPGQANSLDALCRRHQVDNSGREYHGALLDAQLLSEVYLALTGGQVMLGLESANSRDESAGAEIVRRDGRVLPEIVVSDAERGAHRARLAAIREQAGFCLWDKIGADLPESGSP